MAHVSTWGLARVRRGRIHFYVEQAEHELSARKDMEILHKNGQIQQLQVEIEVIKGRNHTYSLPSPVCRSLR